MRRVAAAKQLTLQLVAVLCSDSRSMLAIRQVPRDCTMRPECGAARVRSAPWSIASTLAAQPYDERVTTMGLNDLGKLIALNRLCKKHIFATIWLSVDVAHVDLACL